MFKKSCPLVSLVLGMLLVSLIQASYYEPDLFPIGLSGIMSTGDKPHYQVDNCPYSNTERPVRWTWLNELQLIDALGVNCLGSEDSYKGYIINFSGSSEYDYLHKVCMPAAVNDKPVYLINPTYYSTPRYYDYGPGLNDSTPVIGSGLGNILASTFFRSPERPEYGGYGSARFHPDTSIGGWYPFGTLSDANWDDFDGTDLWKQMVDESVENFQDFFSTHPNYAQYVWDYNLMSGLDKNFKKHSILT